MAAKVKSKMDNTESNRMDQDFTDFKASIAENEETYQHIFNVATDALFFVDRKTGKILDANHSACSTYGYSYNELISMSSMDVSAEPEKTAQALQGAPEGHTIIPIRYHKKKDGTVFPVEIKASLFAIKGREVLLISTHDITRRIQAENILRESEERFKGLSEAVFEGIAIHEQGLILECNDGLSDMTGFSREELIGKDGLSLIASESLDIVRANISSGYEKRYEVLGLRKDGSTYPLAIRGKNVTYKGRAVRVIEFNDITERKKAEENLKESENLLARAQEISHTGSWKLDIILNQLTWSDETYRIFGCSPQEFPATYEEFFDFVHPDDRERVDQAYRRSLLESKSGYEIEHRIVRQNTSEIRHVYERCVHERDGEGTVIKSIGMVQDITEQKKVDFEIKQNRERFEALFDKAPLGYQSLDSGGYFLDVNQQWLDTLGYSKEEVIGKWFGDFLCPEYVEGFRQRFQIFKAQGQIHSEFEMLKKDGNRLVIAFEGKIAYGMDGEFKQTHCILQDITNQVAAEHALVESEKRFREVVRNLDAGVIVHAPDTSIIDCNVRALELLGLNKKQLLGKVAIDPEWKFLREDETLMTPEEFPINLILSSKKPLKDQLLGAYKPAGKDIVWLAVSGTPIFNSMGDISEVVISFIDITKERRQLNEIELSKKRLENIIEATNVGTWEWNVQTGEMIYNERWAKIIGYTLDEIAPVNSETFSRFAHKEDAETAMKIRRQVFNKELVHYDTEIRMKHKDGSWVWVQDKGMVTSWTADGKPLILSGTHTDINQRKQNEINLQKTMMQNQRILDNLQDAYFQVDLSGKIRIANPAGAVMYGYTSKFEMIGQSAASFYADIQERRRFLNKLKEKGEVKDYYFHGRRTDGTTFLASSSAQFVRSEDGEINGIESLSRDITEHKKLEEDIRKQRDSLEQSNKKLEHMLEQSVNAISKIGELRDAYTAGHQKRVQELSCGIARHMGLSEEDILNLSYGALIHDIGKIYIGSDILNKPGKITDLEYQILQTHAEYGYSVVNSIDFPQRIPTMVHQHHERLDGSGYPQGLCKDEIILESRILAVADVVEAMTSHRPYRAALGIEEALKEIIMHKGIKYDADVVDSCVYLFRDKEFKFSL